MGNKFRKGMVIGLVLLFFSTYLAWAETNCYRLLTEDTFIEMESIRSPNISSDGQQIIFSRSWVDKLEDRYNREGCASLLKAIGGTLLLPGPRMEKELLSFQIVMGLLRFMLCGSILMK